MCMIIYQRIVSYFIFLIIAYKAFLCYNIYHRNQSPVNTYNNKEKVIYMKYVCIICGYAYDEDLGDLDNGIDPETMWDDLPDDFECPVCGVSKDEFESDNY